MGETSKLQIRKRDKKLLCSILNDFQDRATLRYNTSLILLNIFLSIGCPTIYFFKFVDIKSSIKKHLLEIIEFEFSNDRV